MGSADYRDLLYSNLVTGPQVTELYSLGEPWWSYLGLRQYPTIFGKFFCFLSIGSIIYLFGLLVIKKDWKRNFSKSSVFLFIAFLFFLISLLPLKLGAVGNRALVLLPFFALISGVAFTNLYTQANKLFKHVLIALLIIGGIIHGGEAASWIYTKVHVDSQKESSVWIENNIANGATIGIENIPIYQSLPNIVMKEFYQKQYNDKQTENRYAYELVDCTMKRLPGYVVISNDEIGTKIMKSSPKKCLVQRLEKEHYRKLAKFSPDFTYYKFFYNEDDYFLAGMIPLPLTISVYKKF
jgi:hypothetical protein